MSLRTLVALPLLYVLPASGQARLLASATLLATPHGSPRCISSPNSLRLLQSIVASATPGAAYGYLGRSASCVLARIYSEL